MPSDSKLTMGNSKRMEEEVMAEIRAALDLPPTSVITIPKCVTDSTQGLSPRESSTAATEEEDEEEETGRSMYEAEEKEVAVKFEECGSSWHKQQRNCQASLDGSTMNDSFMVRMARSSSSIGSSVGISESSSQKYYIGPVDEGEEGSVQSHVSKLGTEDMSHGELVDLVHNLYKELRKADQSLSSEKNRRRSREKNLIKLAKELGKRKEILNVQIAKVAELKEELRVVSFEKLLLEQKLEVQKRVDRDNRAATQKQVDLEVELVLRKCSQKITEREERIRELNRNHAKQCEELCREVVEANQEVMRLQNLLADLSCETLPVDGTSTSTISREETSLSLSPSHSGRKNARRRALGLFVTIVLFCATICLGFNALLPQPVRKMTIVFDSYFKILSLHSDLAATEDKRIDNEREIKIAESFFLRNAIPGMIFDPTLPIKLLRQGLLSKKGKAVAHESGPEGAA